MAGRKAFYIFHAIIAPLFPSNINIRYAIQIALLEVINRKDSEIRAYNNRFAGHPQPQLHHNSNNTTPTKQIIYKLKKSYRQLGYYLESWFELTKRNSSNHNTKVKYKEFTLALNWENSQQRIEVISIDQLSPIIMAYTNTQITTASFHSISKQYNQFKTNELLIIPSTTTKTNDEWLLASLFTWKSTKTTVYNTNTYMYLMQK
ncbi:unnamed protein product [Ambrosiozyma monospora]|uniref:Unnamed protein product n=1 Tax=Ambrosiozyma monospora TaxID=43982 RepID=A0ACB5SZD9_AMBMO|nr:unnamed protein product [Ambrosiozyma monospora]